MAGAVATNVGRIVFWSVLAATPPALWLFAARTWHRGFWWNIRRIFLDYRWHLALFLLIMVEKNWVDSLNDPIRGVFGDKTWLIADIEGDATLRIQRALEHPWLTAFLNVHYLWGYVFLNYFTVILWAYRDDRELADLAALNYSLIYILAIPFYIFFNVQVTSDFIPGMKALLYHAGPGWYDFFVAHDPLDNAFPSLHIAIPFGLLLVTLWTLRRRGYTVWDWEHRSYFWFIAANTAVFAFSILYLGIHWVTDIPGGMLVGLLGAVIADEWRADLFGAFRRFEKWALAPLAFGWRRLRARRAAARGQPPE